MNHHDRKAVALLGAVAALTATVGLIIHDPGGSWWLVAFAGYVVIGALLVWQLPVNRVGWWMLATGVAFISSDAAIGPLADSLSHLPAGLAALAGAGQAVGWLALLTLVTLFPDGHANTSSQRWLLGVLVVVALVMALAFITNPGALAHRANPLEVAALGGFDRIIVGYGLLVVPLLMLVATCELLLRWRRSHGVVRQQYAWLATGVVILVGAIVIMKVGQFAGWPLVLGMVLMNALPVTIGVAVTRYRLYDLDRIITRGTSYIIVSGLLVVTYVVLVASMTRLLPDSSTLVVAISTLASAAVARPLLRRVQALIDRQFNRRRFNAQQIVDHFGTRLRTETDEDAVRLDLLTTVEQALEPQAMALWVRA